MSSKNRSEDETLVCDEVGLDYMMSPLCLSPTSTFGFPVEDRLRDLNLDGSYSIFNSSEVMDLSESAETKSDTYSSVCFERDNRTLSTYSDVVRNMTGFTYTKRSFVVPQKSVDLMPTVPLGFVTCDWDNIKNALNERQEMSLFKPSHYELRKMLEDKASGLSMLMSEWRELCRKHVDQSTVIAFYMQEVSF